MSVEQKVVYVGLSRMTTDRTVIQNAFQYWQANLASHDFDIVDITSKLVSYLGLSSNEKKVLMIAMHAASNKSEPELADVPGYISGINPAQSSSEEGAQSDAVVSSIEANTPQYQVTHGYIRLLVDGVRRKGIAFYHEMDDILKDEAVSGVSKEQKKRIKKYGFSNEMLTSSLSEEECRDLAHELYLLMIDVIGPVSADVVVNQVIDKLLGSDISSRFDPRTLI